MVWLKEMGKQIGKIFLTGLLALLPLIVTIGILVWVVDLLVTYLGPETLLGQALAGIGLGVAPEGTMPYILGWLVVLGGVCTLGAILQLGARNLFAKWMDSGFRRIPLLGSIYGTSKQIIDLFDHRDAGALKGMSSIFCFYGGDGDLVLLGLLVSPETYRIGERDYQIVIIPTSPVPFGGALFYVPTDRILPADITVDALMSIYVSMGVTGREFMPRKDELPDPPDPPEGVINAATE